MLRSVLFRLIRIINLDYFFQRNSENQIYVLVFHKVNNDNSPFYPAVPIDVFENIVKFILKNFNVIIFSEIEDYLKKSRKPAFIITFDDGHYDILENAYPILDKYNLNFNINISTETLETGLPQDNVLVYDVLSSTNKRRYSNDKITKKPIDIIIDNQTPAKTELEFVRLFLKSNYQERRLIAKDVKEKLSNESTKYSRMLTEEDVKYLSDKGVEIGAHTHTHPILPNMKPSELEYELSHSKKILENICNSEINIIAYPNDQYNEAILQKTKELGYKYIMLTEDKVNNSNEIKSSSVFLFRRISLYHKDFNENLAKIFGFHQALSKIKGIIRL